uniref:RING-type domain-containing protein n=1 Tax=viral metagenome TaxID=1070528 RepID=A0A6C0H5C3_9ZZZZ
MFKNIEEIEKKYGLIINKKINNEKILLSIFNSLEIREEDYDLNDLNVLVIIGLYYRDVKKDYENAKKYYLMAVEKGNANGMNDLGYLYHIVEKDYENAKKYYLMAVEKGNDSAMNNLGNLYHNVEKDYENAKKYYLMAIENGCNMAMNNLGYLYYNVEKDYENAKKYYLMAIEKGNANAMNNLGYLYHFVEKDNENAKKYYLMAIEKGNELAINNLGLLCGKNYLKMYVCLKEIKNRNELIENEITNIRKKRRIIEYENKLMYFRKLNNIKYCEICFENDKLHLLMECGHDICKDCFVKVEKCPYCRC